jgi:phosphopantothenoylcysteine synthetase/decarboxylase
MENGFFVNKYNKKRDMQSLTSPAMPNLAHSIARRVARDILSLVLVNVLRKSLKDLRAALASSCPANFFG